MSDIILIKGKVQHGITLDPSVWIFDDRKKRLDEFFVLDVKEDEDTAYQRSIGQQWDKELSEGAALPNPEKEKQLFVQKKDISGDWAVPFKPFLQNAQPIEGASAVICHLESGEHVELDLQTAMDSILCFARDGKPIRQEGPVHLLFADGSNRNEPIKGIQQFEVK
ncbi:peptidyl-prolyl cis-trans isomerase [Ammoniphilus sp. CFH 90114]|uniref:peptidyl-prolyl cis-trans isomerase n=1 Tax=Ammoniphilus sp. CFH 90114 TaxID=2493665 RepID=UPI00100F3E5F|nr:peptidyl-prolyl cis-trans isomerase [Ammoniphilus sp. CFH 90114]RXT13621.1 peptidyl-prolyl cis-trans isomerase [Ammoniphilus sp. CFH 90114]